MDIRSMPKREADKRIEAHLPPDTYKQFEELAAAKQWSKKKLAENVLIDFIKNNYKKKSK